MKFCTDLSGAQWGVGVTPEGGIRLMRRTLSKPYREGDDPVENFVTFDFLDYEAQVLSEELNAVATSQ